MASPIEEFLRQAAEQRTRRQAPAVEIPPVVDPDRSDREERERTVRDGSFEPHIDTHAIADHAGHLGEEVGRADEMVDQHLHEVFDHQVGSLARKSTVTDDLCRCGR